MVKKIYIDTSKFNSFSDIEKKIEDTYINNNDIILVFDVTNTSINNIGDIPKIIKLNKKFKKYEHKLKHTDIICPKTHNIKRGIIKKCVKTVKSPKPVYLIEEYKESD